MADLRERCLAFYQKQDRDAMLRQGDPVQNIVDFVLSEIGRAADNCLNDSAPLVLYFSTPQDRQELLDTIMAEKPSMLARKWP